MNYNINIYRVEDTDGNAVVHLSNPALYVNPGATYTNTVSFSNGTDKDLEWKIVFKSNNTPFYILSGGNPVLIGTNGNPITQKTSAVSITNNTSGDYNYSISISEDLEAGAASEDPQVIIGGTHGANPLRIVLAVLLLLGVGGAVAATLRRESD
jgi:hypothetical protein